MHSTTQCLTFLSPHWANPTATQAHTFEHETSDYIRAVSSASLHPTGSAHPCRRPGTASLFHITPGTLQQHRAILRLVMVSLGTVHNLFGLFPSNTITYACHQVFTLSSTMVHLAANGHFADSASFFRCVLERFRKISQSLFYFQPQNQTQIFTPLSKPHVLARHF